MLKMKVIILTGDFKAIYVLMQDVSASVFSLVNWPVTLRYILLSCFASLDFSKRLIATQYHSHNITDLGQYPFHVIFVIENSSIVS